MNNTDKSPLGDNTPNGSPAAPSSGTGSPGLRVTDTLDAAAITIIRQALGQLDCDSIDTDEAAHRVRRAERLAQCARYGVPVATLASTDLNRWVRRLGVSL